LIDKDNKVDIKCDFCGQNYSVGKDEIIKEILGDT
jgi:redox-regulated HSP33 family molecular chaperone